MPLLIGLFAAVVTAVATPPCIALANRFDIIDRPGYLKTHQSPVPYLGGVAVLAGVLVGGISGRPITLIPLTAAVAVGVADDKVGLPVRYRLVAQLAVGVLIALTVPLHLPAAIGLPLVVAVSIVLINGFNLLDGLDMLAAGVGVAAAVGFAVLMHGDARLLATSIAGALAAFLWFNRPPARLYLGDGGSYLLGAGSTVLLAYAWGVGVSTPIGVVALAVLVLPATEVACAVVRRLRGGRSLTSGDRNHPYDLLVARGWSRTAASAAYFIFEVLIVVAVCVAVRVSALSITAALGIDLAVAAIAFAGAAWVGGLRPADVTSP